MNMRPLPDNTAKRRDKEILSLATHIASHPGSAVSDVMLSAAAISPTCRTSYFHYLNQATENGWIEKSGHTRGARYFPTRQFLHHVAMSDLTLSVARRPKVGYCEDFLASYIPNQTSYLSEKQLAALHRSCGIGTFNASDPTVSQDIRRFMADLTHNSAAFEGVNVKYADTISFIEQNIESHHMSPHDALVLRNHYNAIRFIVENTHCPREASDVQITEYDCRNIHSQLSDGLLKNRAMQGRLRYEHVEIRESSYIPPDQPDIIVKEFSSLINKAREIIDPYEQAVFLLIHIPYLQPFEDCNKRTSRLLCNIPLLSQGILPVSWAEVAPRDYTDSLLCVYEKNSTFGMCDVFVEACQRSFERFEISMKTRQPSRIEITCAKQIQEAIKNRIVYGDDTLPRGINPLQIKEFEGFVEVVLEAIRGNEMVAAPYHLKPEVVRAWIEQESRDKSVADAPH